MRTTEKEQILKLLKQLTHSPKTKKLSYKREDGGTYFTGTCVNVFKKDLVKLLESFTIDRPASEKVEYRKPDIDYRVKFGSDPNAPTMWTCLTLQDVFTQTRSQTETTDKCPFTVVERKVTYRIVPHSEWCSPEMEKKWNDYVRLKKEIGEARSPDKLD